MHGNAHCEARQGRSVGAEQMSRLHVVAFGLDECSRCQLRIPQASLAHDLVNQQSQSSSELIMPDRQTGVFIPQAPYEVLGVLDGSEPATCGCVTHGPSVL
jgi:hypothetical protein